MGQHRDRQNRKMTNFRLTPETRALLSEMAPQYGNNKTAVVEAGVRQLAERLHEQDQAQGEAK